MRRKNHVDYVSYPQQPINIENGYDFSHQMRDASDASGYQKRHKKVLILVIPF